MQRSDCLQRVRSWTQWPRIKVTSVQEIVVSILHSEGCTRSSSRSCAGPPTSWSCSIVCARFRGQKPQPTSAFFREVGAAPRTWFGEAGREASDGFDSDFNRVSRDYFKTMQIPFLAGRDFDARDTLNSPPVAIVNQAFARELGIGPNPVPSATRNIGTSARGFEPIAYLATSQDLRSTNWWVQIVIRSNVPIGLWATLLRGSERPSRE